MNQRNIVLTLTSIKVPIASGSASQQKGRLI